MAKKKRTAAKGKRRFTFEFSLAGLLSLALLSIMILVWIFIFGVLVGRGYRPEALIPQLSRVLPGNGPAPVAEQAPPPAPEKKYQVLKPEELDFHDNLQKLPQDNPPAPRAQSKPLPPPAKTAVAPQTVTRQQKASISQQRFKFVYQVAAFKSLDQAKIHQAMLRQNKVVAFISTADVKGEPWYRVNVTFTGTESEAKNYTAKLGSMGVKDSFLRSKKPL